MDFLQKIAQIKRSQIEIQKSEMPVSLLEKSEYFSRETFSLRKALATSKPASVIAEFKRSSPSAGKINDKFDPAEICLNYEKAGSSAVSVLTDSHYFGGSIEDLKSVRRKVHCPILRKDFIIDEYQVIEAKALGSDAVLLIAELHTARRLEELFRFAYTLGLEVLFEVHEKQNISKIPCDAVLIGINNRDLSSLKVNVEHSSKLVESLPQYAIKVAESGIRSVNECIQLLEAGFNAFLIGEYFMKSDEPGKECKNLIDLLRKNNFPSHEKGDVDQ